MVDTEATSQVSVQANGDSSHVNSELYDTIISNETRRVLEIIFLAALNFVLSGLGSASNVVNIVVFIKQGFGDYVNISLCYLAVSDLGADLTLAWKCLSYNPLVRYSNIDFDSVNDQYITAAWPHRCFVSISNWYTAFIAFERCVCTTLPMKVKDIITPKRTVAVCSGIFVTFSAVTCAINFYVQRVPSFCAERNRTLLSFSLTANSDVHQGLFYFVNVFSSFGSVVVVIVCSSVLIHKLHAMSRWRQVAADVTSPGSSDSMSPRDKRAVKMVTTISVIFMVCNFPIVMNTVIMICFSPAYSQNGRYQHIFHVTWAIINTLEILNSSATIIVYYNMSSKFRVTFNELFFTGGSDIGRAGVKRPVL